MRLCIFCAKIDIFNKHSKYWKLGRVNWTSFLLGRKVVLLIQVASLVRGKLISSTYLYRPRSRVLQIQHITAFDSKNNKPYDHVQTMYFFKLQSNHTSKYKPQISFSGGQNHLISSWLCANIYKTFYSHNKSSDDINNSVIQ